MNTVLAQLRFHSLNIQDRQLPHFREGQIFHGAVLKLMRDDFAMIEISRMPIMAKLETSLQAGQEYWFVVKKNEGTPTLQVLPSSSQPVENAADNRNAQQLLRQLGLPSNTTNITFVSHLQQEGIPFTRSFLQTAVSLLQNLPSLNNGIEVLNIIQERGLPLNQEVFNAVHRFLTAEKPLLSQLQQLITALQQKDAPRIQPMNEQLTRFVETWTSPLNQADNQMSPTQSQQLKQLLSMFGLQYEKSMLNHIEQRMPLEQLRTEQSQQLKPILLSLLKENLPAQTKQLVQDLVHRLTGQQLLLKHDEQMLQLLLQIPIPEQLSQKDAIVQFQSKNKNDQIDTDFCRIIFYLHLHKLKETVIDVHIQKRVVTINVYNEIHLSKDTLKPFIALLNTELEKRDYQLSSVHWFQHDNTTKRKGRQNESPLFQVPRYKGVDIKI